MVTPSSGRCALYVPIWFSLIRPRPEVCCPLGGYSGFQDSSHEVLLSAQGKSLGL